MKPIKLKEIRDLIQGELIQGEESWFIKAAVELNRHKIRVRKTLIFVGRHQQIDWDVLKRVEPCAIITDKRDEELKGASEKVTIIRVEKIRDAFWKFVNYYRNQFDIPIVAITGTCGKTTTREMITHILEQSHQVKKTVKNLNEPRRSFIYLLGIDDQIDVGVFETGLGNPGNLKYHCMIYRPTIGIITTIGIDHLEHCKTIDGYIQAKGEIIEGMDPDGVLILNGDNENIKKLPLNHFKGRVVYFGCNPKADFKAENIRFSENGMEFTLCFEENKYPMSVPGYGDHQVYNALAAVAAVYEIGIGLDEASRRLKTFTNMERHLEVFSGINESQIIDDTWSTNPTSIEAALKVLSSLGRNKETLLLIGDIQQLGVYEKKIHRQVGSLIAKENVDILITVGPLAEEMANQGLMDGFKGKVFKFENLERVKELLEELLNKNSLLLVKGSRLNKEMLQLAEELKVNKNQ
ncbi:UDP-N-acetylmuramoyl-tripeptide--D-alanyl-D-alanine ligase [Bacillaceae bacterium IKA-2]|nr:UDP-N-acetylmuramoyl-tripeptide--D-alanyl-D-alanine ligase [Bacillaceae bacterium IKA-2]